MIVVALAGLLANGAVMMLLRSRRGQPGRQGAYMEVVADTVGSIGVLIAGIVTVTTHWPYADASSSRFWWRCRCCPGDRAGAGGAADPVRNLRRSTSTSRNCGLRSRGSTG